MTTGAHLSPDFTALGALPPGVIEPIAEAGVQPGNADLDRIHRFDVIDAGGYVRWTLAAQADDPRAPWGLSVTFALDPDLRHVVGTQEHFRNTKDRSPVIAEGPVVARYLAVAINAGLGDPTVNIAVRLYPAPGGAT